MFATSENILLWCAGFHLPTLDCERLVKTMWKVVYSWKPAAFVAAFRSITTAVLRWKDCLVIGHNWPKLKAANVPLTRCFAQIWRKALELSFTMRLGIQASNLAGSFKTWSSQCDALDLNKNNYKPHQLISHCWNYKTLDRFQLWIFNSFDVKIQ